MSKARLKNLVNKMIEQSKQSNYTSSSTSSYSRNCSIYFYEWSNLEAEPRVFNDKEDFFKFLSDSNIPEQNMRNELRYSYNSYITCIEGTTTLVRGITRYDLRFEYNRKKEAMKNKNT